MTARSRAAPPTIMTFACPDCGQRVLNVPQGPGLAKVHVAHHTANAHVIWLHDAPDQWLRLGEVTRTPEGATVSV